MRSLREQVLKGYSWPVRTNTKNDRTFKIRFIVSLWCSSRTLKGKRTLVELTASSCQLLTCKKVVFRIGNDGFYCIRHFSLQFSYHWMLLSFTTSYIIHLKYARIFDVSLYLELDDNVNYAILAIWGLIFGLTGTWALIYIGYSLWAISHLRLVPFG